MTAISYSQLPSPWSSYSKVLWSKKPRVDDNYDWKPIEVSYIGFKFEKELVAKYAKICRTPSSAGGIPFFFPHSLLGPIHLAMLTDSRFPMKLLGAVHLRNHVMQHQSLDYDSTYDAHLHLNSYRRRPQGLEVDFTTKITSNGQLAWESVTTYLFRKKFKSEDQESPLANLVANLDDPKDYRTFSVPNTIGKQFGWLTKDINPIHMSSLLAKLFGFKKDLCHGMWALARAVGEMNHIDYQKQVRCDVSFKGPLFIGKDIAIQQSTANQERFQLLSQGNDRPCVVGYIANTTATSSVF